MTGAWPLVGDESTRLLHTLHKRTVAVQCVEISFVDCFGRYAVCEEISFFDCFGRYAMCGEASFVACVPLTAL